MAHKVRLTTLSCDELSRLVDADVKGISDLAQAAMKKKGCPV